jgi:hypothetical protein
MPFDLQPTLRGELLPLRPLRPADYPDLFAVALRSQKAVGKIGGVRVGERRDQGGREYFIYRVTAPSPRA